MANQLLTTTDAARRADLAPGTLRLYDRLGLLVPARDTTGRRLYSPADIAKARALKTEREKRRGSGLRNG